MDVFASRMWNDIFCICDNSDNTNKTLEKKEEEFFSSTLSQLIGRLEIPRLDFVAT